MIENKELDVYKVIAEPNRRKILELLQEADRSVTGLKTHLPITLGAISQHLQLMHRSGLVSRIKRGKQRIYHLEASRLREVDDWLHRFRGFWEDRLDRLGDYLDEHAK
ncbi:MAG: metalloregulator ArsR/SmtB family transcription factor [Woeseiaceae bacterium]|nr:metalloregulator ArsR/SmtB family transcription factor [Woeseiaceae bacterium]